MRIALALILAYPIYTLAYSAENILAIACGVALQFMAGIKR